MAAQLAGVFDNNLQTKINEAKLLVVGAGGIGCEILKNLVLCGFKDIEIVSKHLFVLFFKWICELTKFIHIYMYID